jgi:hypothetical protein
MHCVDDFKFHKQVFWFKMKYSFIYLQKNGSLINYLKSYRESILLSKKIRQI